jgi:hypothetical protein
MSLDRQVTCGIEFPVYISVEKVLGFPAGHKQFSGVVFVTSKMWQNCVIETGQNGFCQPIASPQLLATIVINRTRCHFISAPVSYLVEPGPPLKTSRTDNE